MHYYRNPLLGQKIVKDEADFEAQYKEAVSLSSTEYKHGYPNWYCIDCDFSRAFTDATIDEPISFVSVNEDCTNFMEQLKGSATEAEVASKVLGMRDNWIFTKGHNFANWIPTYFDLHVRNIRFIHQRNYSTLEMLEEWQTSHQ